MHKNNVYLDRPVDEQGRRPAVILKGTQLADHEGRRPTDHVVEPLRRHVDHVDDVTRLSQHQQYSSLILCFNIYGLNRRVTTHP